MKNKLLEKAVGARSKIGYSREVRPYTKDELEVCIAYLEGQITIRQYAAAIDMKSPGQLTHRLSGLIRWGIQEGHVKIQGL